MLKKGRPPKATEAVLYKNMKHLFTKLRLECQIKDHSHTIPTVVINKNINYMKIYIYILYKLYEKIGQHRLLGPKLNI